MDKKGESLILNKLVKIILIILVVVIIILVLAWAKIPKLFKEFLPDFYPSEKPEVGLIDTSEENSGSLPIKPDNHCPFVVAYAGKGRFDTGKTLITTLYPLYINVPSLPSFQRKNVFLVIERMQPRGFAPSITSNVKKYLAYKIGNELYEFGEILSNKEIRIDPRKTLLLEESFDDFSNEELSILEKSYIYSDENGTKFCLTPEQISQDNKLKSLFQTCSREFARNLKETSSSLKISDRYAAHYFKKFIPSAYQKIGEKDSSGVTVSLSSKTFEEVYGGPVWFYFNVISEENKRLCVLARTNKRLLKLFESADSEIGPVVWWPKPSESYLEIIVWDPKSPSHYSIKRIIPKFSELPFFIRDSFKKMKVSPLSNQEIGKVISSKSQLFYAYNVLVPRNALENSRDYVGDFVIQRKGTKLDIFEVSNYLPKESWKKLDCSNWPFNTAIDQNKIKSSLTETILAKCGR